MYKKYLNKIDAEQKEAIQGMCSRYSYDAVLKYVDKLKNLKVLVVGEPIIDSYIFCEPVGLSTKSPTVSTRYLYREDYTGGSWAVAAHLKQLGCQVSMLYTCADDTRTQKLEETLEKTGIKITHHILKDIPTPLKARYMVPFKGQKIFEMVELRSDQWLENSPAAFNQSFVQLAEQHDLVVICDYGHGLFEDRTLDTIKKINTTIALNVQTNSSNYGYNLFTKHQHYNYLAIDEREIRLALHDRMSPLNKLNQKARNRLINKPFSITQGANGSTYYNPKGDAHHCPVFVQEVVDTTGAGDAYFALTSCLVKVGAPDIIVPFLGNVHAGLKSRIVGNKEAVSRDDMMTLVKEIYEYAST